MVWTGRYDEAEPQRVNKWLGQSGDCSRREAEGFIERILERAHATMVGRFHAATPFNYVIPYDERITSPIVA